MRFLIFVAMTLVAVASVHGDIGGQKELKHEERHYEERKGGLGGGQTEHRENVERVEHNKPLSKRAEEQRSKSKERTDKEHLVTDKKQQVFFHEQIEFFRNNPLAKMERECFAKLKPGQSIDFVIDIAPSPTSDKVDKQQAESPIALFLERAIHSASRAYFGSVQFFIDAVTLDMKPEATHSIIYESGRKFYVRGRRIDNVEAQHKGEFTDEKRNLKTLWPTPTKEVVSNLFPIVKNNLGRMTKLALWNRDNGVPVVLYSSRRSKPVYTVVITDGASGAKINDLVGDVEDWRRVTVIDIGNRRFASKLSWDEMKKFAGVYTLIAPQQLPLMLDSVRNMACQCVSNVEE